MPIDPSRYILPPPVGVANDMYEATNQPADTVFSSPYVPSAVPVRTQSIFQNNNDVIGGIMGDVRGLPPGLENAVPSNIDPVSASSDQTSFADSAMGTGGTDGQGQSKFNGWANFFGGQTTGLPSGNTGTNNPGLFGAVSGAAGAVSTLSGNTLGATLATYFIRGVVVILGFIFVAVGLTMLGAQTRMGNSIIREVRGAIPR